MSSVKIIEPNFTVRDAQLSDGMSSNFRQPFGTAFARYFFRNYF